MSLSKQFDNCLTLPVVAAPMFLASGPDLVLACCRAGIVGTFPAKNQRTLDGLEEWLVTIRAGLDQIATDMGRAPPPFGVNLIVHRTNRIIEEELALCVKHKVPLVITSLGAVPELIAEIHGYGGLVFHDVINLRHAKKAADAGVDGLIAVAAGAGGHTGQASPFGLINEIRQFFDGTVLLSGSLSTGSDIAAAQTMGADLAYLGTRFINTAECQSPEGYKQMIIDSAFGDVVATPAVSGVNANFLTASLANAGFDLDAPHDHGLVDIDKELAEALTEESNSFKAWRDIWSAGHGVGSIDDIPSVAELVARLHAEYHNACVAQQENRDKLVPMDRTA